MAVKITDLTALAVAPADNDLFILVDVSDTTMAATGTDKKIAYTTFKEDILTNVVFDADIANMVTTAGTQTLTNKTIDATSNTIQNTTLARSYLGTTQTNISLNANVKVNMGSETYDLGSNYDTANYRYVAPYTGYYEIAGQITYSDVTANTKYRARIFVNGANVSEWTQHSGLAQEVACGFKDTLYVVAGQYIELYAIQNSGGTAVDILGSEASTFMTVTLVHKV